LASAHQRRCRQAPLRGRGPAGRQASNRSRMKARTSTTCSGVSSLVELEDLRQRHVVLAAQQAHDGRLSSTVWATSRPGWRVCTVGDVALVLIEQVLLDEVVHHGHDGGVGDLATFAQRLVDLRTVVRPCSQTTARMSASSEPMPVNGAPWCCATILAVPGPSRTPFSLVGRTRPRGAVRTYVVLRNRTFHP